MVKASEKAHQSLKVEDVWFEIGDIVKLLSSDEIRRITGTRDPDMYETQVGMDAGTKWFHKGSELELVQKAPSPNRSPDLSPRGELWIDYKLLQ